mmetsp:Transcript_7297/g.14994  ORF Transcript_7297/g.14994 Transcript_7297/m.14994 type:complete len:80 (-) Transcript_7297:172-411(-)
MLPIMVPTNIETTSKANDDNNRKRINRFVKRIHFLSFRFAAIPIRVSDNVTKTAAAISADGAPILAVHSQASNAFDVSS